MAGNAGLVVSVGGELDTPTIAQRAVVLVRGESTTRFVFDGQSFDAAGQQRATLGAGVGGGQ